MDILCYLKYPNGSCGWRSIDDLIVTVMFIDRRYAGDLVSRSIVY